MFNLSSKHGLGKNRSVTVKRPSVSNLEEESRPLEVKIKMTSTNRALQNWLKNSRIIFIGKKVIRLQLHPIAQSANQGVQQ